MQLNTTNCYVEVEVWRRKKQETNPAICEILTQNVNSFFEQFFHSAAVLAALGPSYLNDNLLVRFSRGHNIAVILQILWIF